ncbi:probable protein phosphatase 2C 37 [Lolium perenne]|uniref:probable protein phosphatase 2C 37 n=1 Tax=Lolium perenne TaxID=4522 RepID=UPI0021F5A8C7|nr:probable protein phosphatase 2C 37 [Lolium perenne]
MVMASAGVNNMPAGPSAGAEGSDPAAECRLRRRRRLALLRHVTSTSAGSDESAAVAAAAGSEEKVQTTTPTSESSEEEPEGASAAAAAAAINVASATTSLPSDAGTAAAVWPVAFGSVALAGRLREMEDTVSLHPSFCVWADGSPMHFFAVFDGHGGPHVAALCREQMHSILATELAAAAAAQGHGDEEGSWRAALSRSFARVDALAPESCACGRAAAGCACPLSSGQRGAIVGSTAVVALLVRDRLVVANCGDSRAVLCRGAHAVPLSEDQKPDRPDERARIEAMGGRVMFINGARVRGILAMSRALGHKLLKPEVICEPEITITTRSDDDECLILASDGLWDVISNKVACDVARQCLEDGSPTRARTAESGEAGPSSSGAPVAQQPEPRCYRAAALLARLALGRESSDNISVVVIDLKARG